MCTSKFLSSTSLCLRVLCVLCLLPQPASAVYFIVAKQWLIQELVLKETPFLFNPLSQCCFFSRTHDSRGYSQGCCSLCEEIFKSDFLYHPLNPGSSPRASMGGTPSPSPSFPSHGTATMRLWKTLSLPSPSPPFSLSPPLRSFLPGVLLCGYCGEGSCLPMESVSIISYHSVSGPSNNC